MDLPDAFDQATDATATPAPGALWAAFGVDELDALIARALQASPTVAEALAHLDETRALRGVARLDRLPLLAAGAGAERDSPSEQDPFLPPGQERTDTWRAGFDLRWEVDLWGALRREAAAIDAETGAREAALEDLRAGLVAEVAQAWFALRGAQELLALQERSLQTLAASEALLERRLRAGRGTQIDVLRLRALRETAQARVPQTRADVVRQELRLATLTAQPVARLRAGLAPRHALPDLPALVAAGAPIDWLRRRPDVRAAERRLAAETARIGVATAEFFPQVTLSGAFGWTAQDATDLGSTAASRWRFGPTLAWSFPDVARILRRVAAQESRAGAAFAAWQQAVLLALEETERALSAYRAAADSAAALTRARDAAKGAADLVRVRLDAGAADGLELLDAERVLLERDEERTRALTAHATALAHVYKALAGEFLRPEATSG